MGEKGVLIIQLSAHTHTYTHTQKHTHTYIYNFMISYFLHGFPWLSYHSSLLSIASGRSSRLNPTFVQNCCKFVVGRPTLPCDGVHRRTSLMSLSLLQQCPHVLSILFGLFLRWELGGHMAADLWDLFNITRRILIQFLFSLFFICLYA